MNIKPKLKTVRVELRLAPNQKDVLIAKALKANMTMTEYIIHQLSLGEAL